MPHIQKLISAIFCPISWSGCVNLLSSGITWKNLRSRPIGIARFSGVSLLGIVTFVQGYLMRTTPFSSSLYWSIACLKISLTQIGYFSLHLDVIERDSIQFFKNWSSCVRTWASWCQRIYECELLHIYSSLLYAFCHHSAFSECIYVQNQ